MQRPKIKICGVNDAAFAAEAERLGADYIGLIFAEGSPRRIDAVKAREILASLSGRAVPVAVFTSTPADQIVAMVRDLGVHVVQLHRRASAEDVDALRSQGLEVWTLAGGAEADAMLFDSSHGDGEKALRHGPWKSVLAGGISAENVARAIGSGADVIDASGSLESSPGVKSIPRLRAFFDSLQSG